MSQTILNPFPPYVDAQGNPLQDGKLYIGNSGQIAEASPLTVYWDRALTQPAAQPLFISGGQIMYIGTPANVFYSGSDYSMTLKDKNDVPIFTLLSAQASGYTDQVITVPTIPVSNDNIVQNSNFEFNSLFLSGTVVLSAGQPGHDLWVAGSGGCTYTFTTSQGVTTITIVSGTLLQIVPGYRIFTNTYWFSWNGTAQGRVNTGAYGVNRAISLTGGSNTTLEFSAGTLSQIQLIIATSAIGWKPSNNLFRAEEALQTTQLNLLYNSGFAVNQDQYPINGSSIILASNQLGFDGWRAGPSGCTFSATFNAGAIIFNITAGSLQQTIEAATIVKAGTYSLTWSGTSPATMSATTAVGQILASFNGATNVVVSFGIGSFSQPSCTFGQYVIPYVVEDKSFAFMRCMRYRQYFTSNNTVYGAIGQVNVKTLNFSTPLRISTPTFTTIIAPTYVNGSGFNVVLVNNVGILEKFTTTALGLSTCNSAYSLDCTL
jgi:hypothetical protein